MKKTLQIIVAALMVLTAANTYAQVTEDFEPVPGHAGTVKDYLILQNWQFPDFDVNPEGTVAIAGSQSMGAGPSYKPDQFTGVVTPFLNFSNSEALQFSYKIHRPLNSGCRRWFLVNLVDQSANVIQVDSVEIDQLATSTLVYNLNISGHSGIYALYINVRGDGCNAKMTMDDFFYSGSNAGINQPAGLVMQATGVNNIAESTNVLALYPNPSSSNLNIQLNSDNSQDAQVEIYNVNGAKVYTKATELNAGANTLSLNVETLSSGNYFVSIRTNDGVVTKRFAKI
ncbi:MAG: T9SS type A sorting domain-containing protein [Chitinophagales bacterium]